MPVESQDYLDESHLNNWQIEEIRRAIHEADRDEFASDEEVQQIFARLTRL
jgi:predicted transcriptional regulator